MLKDHFEAIFETCALLLVFLLGALLLAWFPDNEELANWISGGIVIGVLARAFQSNGNGKGKDKTDVG